MSLPYLMINEGLPECDDYLALVVVLRSTESSVRLNNLPAHVTPACVSSLNQFLDFVSRNGDYIGERFIVAVTAANLKSVGCSRVPEIRRVSNGMVRRLGSPFSVSDLEALCR